MAATTTEPADCSTYDSGKSFPSPENFRAALIWLVIAMVLAVIGWSVLLAILDTKKREAEHDALREAASLSRSYARHLDRAIEAIDQILLHVKYEWELSRGSL